MAGLQAGTTVQLLSASPTLSTLGIACFAEGTRVLTVCGEWCVEALRPGDILVTAAGRRRRVIWTGHRRIDCTRHPHPYDVQPVRVHAHAFGPDAPHADLLLSPDHAVFMRGALIPVRYLVNGATVAREEVGAVTYWHVELDAHDVLLAHGVPCESYLDTGNRGAFVECEGAAMLHADFARRVWERDGCAPLAVDGAPVEAVRRMLVARADALGHVLTDDPDLLVLVDGISTVSNRIGENIYRFRLRPGTRTACLVSRNGRPAETSPTAVDHRRLGVAVAALRLDGESIALDDPRLGAGWHAPEPGWRWTDGRAAVSLAGESCLDVTVALAQRYWLPRLRRWPAAQI